MWCCKFIFKDIICLMRSWFPLYKGEQGSYRYIKPRTTIRLCSIQFRNVYRLRLILVLHYTIVSFWCHPICRPNKVTERKWWTYFHPIVSYIYFGAIVTCMNLGLRSLQKQFRTQRENKESGSIQENNIWSTQNGQNIQNFAKFKINFTVKNLTMEAPKHYKITLDEGGKQTRRQQEETLAVQLKIRKT